MIDSPYSLSQNPDDKNETPSDITQSNNFWRWLTYLILLSLGGGVSYSWYFFTQQLIPSIEKSVTNLISRPVKLGKIEAISFNTIRLGESSIETTAIENDFVIAEGVEIKFNPLQLLANQEINIGINILNPQGFLQQNQDDSWIQIQLNNQINNNFLGKYIHVDNISLADGFINIKSTKSQGNYQKNITKINLASANINFEKNKQFFEVNGRLNNQNKIAFTGLHYPEKTQWLLKINTKNLPTNTLNNFIELPVDIDSGEITGDLSLNFVQEKLDNLEANLDFNLVNLTLPNIVNKLTKSAGNLQIRNEIIELKNVETHLDLIPAKVNGSINNNQLNLQVSAKNPVEISQVFSSLKIDTGDLITKGKIAADLRITGDINQPKIATKINSVGKTRVDNIIFDKIAADLDIFSQALVINNFELLPTIGGKVNGNGKVNLSKKDDSFSLTFRGIDIEGEKVATLYQQKLPMKIGLVNGDYQLFGNWRDLSESRLTGNSSLELETGKATINNFEIDSDTWRGEVKVSGVGLTQLPNLDCEKIGCGDTLLNGEFFVRGRRQEITPENIDLTGGKFNFDLAGGRVIFHNTSLTKGNWQTNITLDNLSLSQLPSLNLSSGSIETGTITGELRVGGVLNKNEMTMIRGKGNLFLPQGKVEIDNLTWQNDNFSLQTKVKDFSLTDFGDNFRGGVTGEIIWRGDVNKLTADNLNLEGNLIFSQGIDIIHQPLSTDFIWNGEVLEIKEVRLDRTAPLYDKVYGRGIISYDKKTETLADVNLEIIAKGIDLKTLPLPSSLDVIKYQGNIDFQGRLIGDISQPNLTGKINLHKFQLANIDFSPLTGNLTTSAKQGINIKLDSITAEDKLYIDIDNQNQPQKIEIQNNNSRIEAVRENETLAVTANNIPLDKVTKTWLTYLPDDIKKIGGNFSGDIQVNLIDNNFIATNILIEKPTVNNFQGDTLTTKLISEGDVIKIEEGKIQQQENEYLFSGELISLGNNPQVKGKVEIKEGDIQNFLRSWGIFELKDFSSPWQPRQHGKAKDLYSSPLVINSDNSKENLTSPLVINSDNELKPLASIQSDKDSLFDTLDLFGKIQAELKQQQANRIHGNIPVLEDLDGKFRGNVDFSFSFNNGFQGEFDFRGDDWQWGKYQANFVQATGSFGDCLLTLLPIQIQNNDSILSLNGTYSKERISGDIKLLNFSISQLKEIISLPNNFNIEGNINSTIAISGSEKKPLAKGNIEIIDSKINGTQIDETSASFGFRNSRIDFLANSNLTDNSQSLKIIGSLPFQLFSNSIIPENNNFQVSLNLAKEGFSLLNIVTNNQLNWLSGDGNINLDINGKYYQLTNTITNVETQGIATFENGVIDGKILADKSIKDINGEVLFDFSQLTIPNLTGNFNGGNISISGSLPIIDSGFSNEFLTISVDDLALDIDNLYEGNTQAMVFIGGSSIEPKIGGKIKLYNGEISLNNKFNNYQNNSDNNGILSNVKIDNLDLILGNNISITQSPLLYLKAEGNLKLNGDLSSLNPEGIINLTGGNLNLFTSQFNLANGNNIAKFTPEKGFNPYLDIQLESRVTETNRYKLTNNYHPNEIEDFSNSSFNTAQTVRVKADIKGWSNNIENNIILSSNPQRNQTEIIALLGGGFFDNFTEGDSSLGLANLASAALLGSVQGQLQQNFGFNQLRLFPTQIFDVEKRTSSLAFGAELGLDITKDFSLSITKILTTEQSPQYNILYRLNDKTILRGSSDFDRDSRGVIEFEHRF